MPVTARKIVKILLGAVSIVIAVPVALLLVILAYAVAVNRADDTLVSSGETREYLLYVPKTYDRAKPTPLVISLHAAMNWSAFQMNLTRWNALADENRFIVVYPAGNGAVLKTWFMRGSRNPSRMPDVVFISDLIDKLNATYNIDPARIYANGMSNGGGMAFALSCTLSDRIAAIGAVSAAQSLPWSWRTQQHRRDTHHVDIFS